MVKRIFIYLGSVLILAGVFFAYQWFRLRQVRIAAQREVDEYVAQHKTLESFGDLALDTATLTFAKLEERLRKPSMRLASSANSSRLGWACKEQDCLIWAWFAVPVGGVIAGNEVPVALMVSDPWGSLFGSNQHVSVSGAYLGEPEGQFREFSKKRGCGLGKSMNHITWNENWSLIWTSAQGKINSLYCLNDPLLQKAALGEKSLIPQSAQDSQAK
jgi:hypothetical protein